MSIFLDSIFWNASRHLMTILQPYRNKLFKRKKPNENELDILLIPPLPNPVFTEQFESFMPLGLLALMASLNQENFRVELYKPVIRIFNRRDFMKVARDILSRGSSIIGFSTWCVSYTTSLHIARYLKKLNSDIVIIFGGPHASETDIITLDTYPFVDYILRGEADQSLVLLLTRLLNRNQQQDFSNVPGLTFRDTTSGTIKRSDVHCTIPDLNLQPLPAYEMFSGNTIKLDIGRGCPFKCTYCSTSSFFSKKFRVKSVSRVKDEIDYCIEKTGITSFGFSHDMFTANKEYVLSLCSELKKYSEQKGFPITWTCSSRPDTVNFELLKEMKNAGCQTIFFGIESGSPKIQKSIRKNLNLDKVLMVAEWCSELNIQMIASFMAGFPDEKEEDIDQSIRLILRLIDKGAKPQMSLLSVLPGTDIYEKYHKRLEFDGRFSDFSAYQPIYSEYKMIKNDPILYSSFHFLPVEDLARDHLYALSRLVNNIREFRYTSKILAGYFSNHLDRIQLFSSLMGNLETYRRKNTRYTELFFLMDLMESIINYAGKNGLPDYSRDLLVAESAQIVVKRKYLKKQLIKPKQARREDQSKTLTGANKITINPNWVQITTSYDVMLLFEELRLEERKVPEPDLIKGKYHYIVIAVSEKKSRILQISKEQSLVLNNMKDITVDRILNRNLNVCDRKVILDLLNALQDYGVVEVIG